MKCPNCRGELVTIEGKGGQGNTLECEGCKNRYTQISGVALPQNPQERKKFLSEVE